MVRARLLQFAAISLALVASLSFSHGADTKTKPTGKEIDALRQTIEDQSKQIEALTQQIAHLTEVLEAHGISTAATPSPSPSPSPESSPAVTSGSAQPATETPGSHTVTKGETLTSIAKHYKIPVAELQKVNKIENDRMLQIGQVLIIPTATPSPTPEEKKENQ